MIGCRRNIHGGIDSALRRQPLEFLRLMTRPCLKQNIKHIVITDHEIRTKRSWLAESIATVHEKRKLLRNRRFRTVERHADQIRGIAHGQSHGTMIRMIIAAAMGDKHIWRLLPDQARKLVAQQNRRLDFAIVIAQH